MVTARWMLGVAALATAAFGQVPARQQAYNAAQAAYDASNWQAAADGFAPLLAGEGRSSRTDGIIRARYAWALAELGRLDEAEAQAARAVREFPEGDGDENRADAYATLAKVRTTAFDLPGAVEAFDRALGAAPPGSVIWLESATGLLQASLTVDPGRAFAAAQTIIADTARFTALTKTQQGQLLAFQAVAKLNEGDAKAALPIVRRALALTGGLNTGSIDLVQAMVRNDAALVMLRAGLAEEARTALAHAGGGYMPDSSWLNDGANELPVCDDTVRPDDVAVVEFAVASDGSVPRALPVFASRPGRIGVTFAAKVRSWHFAPATVAKVKPFWRYDVRLELRCVTRPASLTLSRAFDEAATQWLATQGLMLSGTKGDLMEIKRAGPVSPAVEALVQALARYGERRPWGSRRASDGEVRAALVAAGAPTDVLAAYAYRGIGYNGGSRIGSAGTRAAAFASLADTFAKMHNGARAAAWFDVEAAVELETAGHFADARPRLDRAGAASPEILSASDPIRVVATLHRALVERKLGDAVAAEARLRAAGLDAEQCQLFDVRPLPVREGASWTDFPAEALRWQMEGFAQTAFDIDAAGKVTRARTIKAYPPFVFGPGSEQIVARFRYLPPTLNNVALGCSAMDRVFRFVVPGRAGS